MNRVMNKVGGLFVVSIISILAMCAVPMQSRADDNITSGDYTFSIATTDSGDSYATVTGYVASDPSVTDITVPSSVGENNIPVQAIAGSVFAGQNLTSIVLPDSITTIGADAFSKCGNLKSINIPNGVTDIGAGAFSGCSALTIYGEGQNTVLESYVSDRHIPLVEYSVDTNTATACITKYLSDGESTTIEIPGSIAGMAVTSISTNAFDNCYILRTIILPDSITSVDGTVFNGCSNAVIYTGTNINISTCSQPVMQWCLIDGGLSVALGAFSDNGNSCTTDIELPSTIYGRTVTTILDDAFESDCSCLSSVVIPMSVTTISGDNPSSLFDGCGNTIIYLWSSGILYSCLPASVTCNTYVGYEPNNAGDTVTITGHSFDPNIDDVWINIPLSIMGCPVTSIGDSAFEGFSTLTYIYIPDSVVSIGNSAFAGCIGLQEIDLSCNLSSMGTYVFQNCAGLAQIIIPDGITALDTYAFDGCSTNLLICGTKIIGNQEAVSSNGYAFLQYKETNGTIEITDYTAPKNGIAGEVVMYIPDYISGKPVTKIGPDAFADCTYLTSISLPSSIECIDDSAFKGCNAAVTIQLIAVPRTRPALYGVEISLDGMQFGYDQYSNIDKSRWCYAVYRLTPLFGVTCIGNVSIGNRAYIDFPPGPGTYYYYIGDAYITAGGTKIYTPGRIIVSGCTASTVSNLRAMTKYPWYARLAWDSLPGAAGYEVYSATSKTGKYTLLRKVATNKYTDIRFSGKMHYYKVRPYKIDANGYTYGDYSDVV